MRVLYLYPASSQHFCLMPTLLYSILESWPQLAVRSCLVLIQQVVNLHFISLVYVYFNFKLIVCQFLPCEFCLYFRFFFREFFTMSFLLTSFLLICFMIYYIVYVYLALAHLAVCLVCAHDTLSVLSCEFYESVVIFISFTCYWLTDE